MNLFIESNPVKAYFLSWSMPPRKFVKECFNISNHNVKLGEQLISFRHEYIKDLATKALEVKC